MKITVRQLKRIIREAVIREAFWNKKWTLDYWKEGEPGTADTHHRQKFNSLKELLHFTMREFRHNDDITYASDWVPVQQITPRPTYEQLLAANPLLIKYNKKRAEKEWEEILFHLGV